jgi:hypothetical protein
MKKQYKIYLFFGILISLLSQQGYSSSSQKAYAPRTSVVALPKLWKLHLTTGKLPTCILEQGGGGDCFFYSIAAAMGTLNPANTAQDLRRMLSLEITEANWEEHLMQIGDGLMVAGKTQQKNASPLVTESIYWFDIFSDQMNYPGEPWKLLRDVVANMASGPPITIIRGPEVLDLDVSYWGNLWAIRMLSCNPSFDRVRIIPLNSRNIAIGEVISQAEGGVTSTAKVFEDHEHEAREVPKELNILLWWTGGHYQIVAKQVEVSCQQEGILHLNDNFYSVIWPNDLLPLVVKDLYRTLCHYDIS